VIAVLLLGSGKLFKSTITCILFFDGSVNGLDVGAPVAFRGVQIGQVSEIKLQGNRAELSFSIPVLVEIDPDQIVFSDRKDRGTEEYLAALIKKGLRAQLQAQSIVTGLLFVNLDFASDSEPNLVRTDEPYTEIPTIRSQLQEISRTLESIPIKDIVHKFAAALTSINKIVDNEDARQFFVKLSALMENSDDAITKVNKILSTVDEHAAPTAQSLQDAAESAAAAGASAEKAFADVEGLLADGSLFRFRMDGALDSFTNSMRSLRTFSDYLDRHPNSLLFGKEAEGSE